MKIYITFGQIHVHSINGKTLDKDCVAVIEAETHEKGRKIAMDIFDGVFHQSLNEPPDMSFFPRGLIEI